MIVLRLLRENYDVDSVITMEDAHDKRVPE